MVVGLGSGSTAAFARGPRRARRRWPASPGHPTSEATARWHAGSAFPWRVSTSTADRSDDDGADQVERGTLHLIKGLGGALLREKIVATASARLIVAVRRV